MEHAFGADLGSVRVHRGPEATTSAAAFRARAYTVGEDIVLGETSPEPRTLAHELTHVLQQRAGPVEGRPIGGGVRVSDPADRFERAAATTAERVVSGQPASGVTPGSPGLQRQEQPEDEEEAVATLPLQRQDMPEDEEEAVATLPLQRQDMPEDEEEAVATLPLQRQDMPEDEEEAVATLPLQRQDMPEDEEEAVATLPLQRQDMPEDEEEPSRPCRSSARTCPRTRRAVAALPLQRQDMPEDGGGRRDPAAPACDRCTGRWTDDGRCRTRAEPVNDGSGGLTYEADRLSYSEGAETRREVRGVSRSRC